MNKCTLSILYFKKVNDARGECTDLLEEGGDLSGRRVEALLVGQQAELGAGGHLAEAHRGLCDWRSRLGAHS